MTSPTATYRLQLRSGMTFERAASLAPRLADLGISHLYLSPIFKAVRDSTHGYDVADNTVIDPALGGEAGFRDLVEALRRRGIGLILDFVPNHMAANPQNPWWRDVLEWGSASRYAQHFDIDWSAPKLILPVLNGSYGDALERGELGLAFSAGTGDMSLTYGDLALPLTPSSYAEVLGLGTDNVLAGLATRFSASTPDGASDLKSELAAVARDPAVASVLDKALDATRIDRSRLHAMHECQIWQLIHWRAAREMLTHRRFFEITDLVGVRVELQEVFDDVHARVIALAKDRSVDGLRLDHVDGLSDPQGYLARLQATLGGENHFYLLVEKILAPCEVVRSDWPVAGTTGYEFIHCLAGLLVNSAGECATTKGYHGFIGQIVDYEVLVRSTKRRTLTHNFAGELRALTHMAQELAARHLTTRDMGPDTLRSAIVELASALPIYRTYVTASAPDPEDRSILEATAEAAKRERELEDGDALDFVKRAILLDVASPADRQAALKFATRFQQTSGALMAKAVEDTAFYRYNRLLALNEVGGEPSAFGASLEAFHRAMSQRLEQQPFGLSATATHDTKRGEDARARLYVLSEMPEIWVSAVERWREQNRALKRQVSGHSVPDAEAEWVFYQALMGAWPPDLPPDDASGLAALAYRMAQFCIKASREAKLHTSWTAPNPAYEEALGHFARCALDPGSSSTFLVDFVRVLQPVANAGALNSLTQTLIKLAAPGVPDVYQGTELWDFSMVDPDNRRPVDFDRLARLADDVEQRSITTLLHEWRSGAIKLQLLKAGLRLRAEKPELFSAGTYLPLKVTGDHRDNVVAFARVTRDQAAVAVGPRIAWDLLNGVDVPMVQPSRWRNTTVTLPASLAGRRWTNVCTGGQIDAATEVALHAILHISPVSLMTTISVDNA